MNELTINLKTDSKIPLYEQIYTYIKKDIQAGRISYGEKLPSTRALSRHLEVSRSTVELAYEQLLSEGFIEAAPYRGFYVAQIDELYHFEQSKEKGIKKEIVKEKYKYDFSPNGVDLNSFPYNVWRKLSKDILIDDKTELFRAGDSQGEYGFRNAVCNYLYQARGVNCVPEQIIIGAGSDYIVMLLGIILGPSHKIAFEDPTYKQAYRLAKSLSYSTIPVSMDKNGMKVNELSQTDADIAYVTPSHQYPTGIVMPIKRRMELLKWANDKEERYIIEDDYDSEFRYKGKPIPALQGYDGNGKVIYLGTFSKSIAPAIRLSYMVLPKPLLELYNKHYRFINSTVSKVDQMIVQRFLEEGYYERHLNKMRAMYKGRHDTLIEALKPLSDVCTISGEHAGVHLLLTFHGNVTEEELIEHAKEKSIRVYGMSDYLICKEGKAKAIILLGYANLSEEQIKEAIHILTECWSGLLRD
ncbi:MAG: PLP-dependent aminotransferase family protein [Lachnospiraceae bacterium]